MPFKAFAFCLDIHIPGSLPLLETPVRLYSRDLLKLLCPMRLVISKLVTFQSFLNSGEKFTLVCLFLRI